MKKILFSMLAFLALCLSGCSKEASSIGVIGGADGPTAVFVAGGLSNFPLWIWAVMILAIVVFIAVFFITRHK